MTKQTSQQLETGTSSSPLPEWKDLLPFEKGSHGSAEIAIPPQSDENDEEDPFDASTFRDRLAATVTACRELGKSSIWIEVPLSRSSLMETGRLQDLGFQLHHCRPTVSVLNLWLQETENKIPDYATHHVGVGAVVMNSANEILCVRELRRNYMPWKTPTGLSELGECIDEAAVREVWEETGIQTTFRSVLGFRQTHGLKHGRSDLFFVCRLDPVEEYDENGKVMIPQPVAQANEIERAEWVPWQEYRDMVLGDKEQPGHPMMKHIVKVLESSRRIEKTMVESIVPGRGANAVYYPCDDNTVHTK